MPEIERGEDDAVWAGDSGTHYTYFVYSWPVTLSPVPGNFILARREADGWHPIRIDETDELADVERNLMVRSLAIAQRATHLHVRLNYRGTVARQAEVRDLMKRWRPSGNELGWRNPEPED